MCGISGILQNAGRNIDPSLLETMTQSVSHRGPDGYGYAVFNALTGASIIAHNRPLGPNHDIFNVGLGHRRLAVIDLSETGNQPMQRNHLCLTFNGEIYNYLELREELKLKGYVFSSASDTEVILHAYSEWGVSCLDKFSGMFAFALWDQEKKRLFCARDRFGIKPFYYYRNPNEFLFASEIKQFFHHPSIKPSPNDPMVYDYLVHGFLDHSEQTLFKDIRQLEPGCYMLVDSQAHINIQCYWKLDDNTALQIVSPGSDFPQMFFELFARSVREHLRSDTTIGGCLSGGLDSTAITCLANYILKENNAAPMQTTFSSVFTEGLSDEREYSDAVIEFLGITNKTVFPEMSNILSDIHTIMDFHDEPFGSTSQYAQWKLYEKIQNAGIKVVLNGQGADEILAGYHSCYGAYHLQLLKEMRWLSLSQEIRFCREHHRYTNLDIGKFMVSAFAIHTLGPRLSFLRPAPLWLNKDFYHSAKNKLDHTAPQHSGNLLSDFLIHLIQFNLRSLLRYEDRNSMAHSVESRLPFLDHRLVEFLFSLPRDQIIDKGWTKSILRGGMKDRMPEVVRKRKDKVGFATPEQNWMLSLPTKVIDDALGSKAVKNSGYFNTDETRKEISAITQGRKPFRFLPWRILNLCVWLDNFHHKTVSL